VVSVIVPCYNQARFVADAIESVLAQTYTNVEIIVVNDGSTDHTADVVARYQTVGLIQQANRGLAAARNVGFDASRGKYIVFLDADDRLMSDALGSEIACLTTNPECAFVYGHVRLIDTEGALLPTPPQSCVDADQYVTLLAQNYIWTTGAVMYRREILDTVGGFDALVNASADLDLNVRITRTRPIRCLNKVVLEYRVHETNMSKDSTVMLRSSMAVLRAQWPHVRGKRRYERALKAGIRGVQEEYGNRLGREAQAHMERREWRRAAESAVMLLRYYPSGVVKYGLRRLPRIIVKAAGYRVPFKP
jgi:glycosyltransferase involved in cell wall biosynthesis